MPTDANPSKETPSPAPTGSAPSGAQRPWYRPSGRWIVFFVVLLALNLFLSSRAMEPRSRVRVPYSPFFLQQVEDRQRRGDHVQGDGHPGHVREGGDLQGLEADDAVPDGDPRLRQHRRALPAAPGERRHGQRRAARHRGAPWWQTLLFGFGPTILFVVLLFWLFRRAGNVQNALGSFGRSRARRYEPSGDKVTFADVAGIEEAKDELSEVVDFLRHPDKYRPARRPDPARRPPLGPARDRQDAARARGRRRGERPVLLDGRLRVRRGDRRRRRRARARPVQGGEGERSGDRLHRRARRDRPLADERHRRLQRRQRRARADAEPDPDRDGRVRLGDERHRHRGDEPARRARPGAASARAVRPPRRRPAAGPRRAARRSCACTRAASRSAPTSTSPGSRRRRRAWSAPTSPTSSTRRRSPPRGAPTTWSRRRTSPTRSSGSCSAPSGR